ncbi:MAG: hypothetical protein IIW19_05005, partial [Clostridia bacterium]|nr:hypothetical protein [Clostridia bacterium]
MKSKMNRALSMLFALVMIVTVFPVMTSTAVAAEIEAQGADILTYEDLYVKDGLVAWFDAFGVNNATVDLVNGTWTDKIGGSVATVKGASTWWKFRENGGFGYDMTQAEWKASWSAVEVAFDINLLNETAFTFETFLTPYGPVDAEGNRSQTSDGWGNYNGSSTFINVGNLRTLQFGNHTTYSTFETRFVYTKNSDGWNSNQGAGSGITNGAQIRNLATAGLPVGMSFVYNHTVSTVEIPAAEEGGEPTYKDIHTAIYNCYKDGTSKFLTYNSQTTSVGNKDRDNDGDGENDYWWQKLYYPVLPTGSLKIAGAFPSTVYSARVYDRILSSAEMARNHAADIIALTGADLSPITVEDEDAILFLVSALATMDGSATKAEVEAAVAKSVATAADCLYVTDGLILWLDGSDATTVDLANGKWYSKAGNVSATMRGTWKASTVIEGAGYRYDLESASANSGLDLPLSLVSSDYTLEFWAISRGLTQGADGTTPAINDSQWGGGQSTSMAIGFLVADSFAAERTPGHQYYNSNCSFNELAWYPAEKVTGGSLWATYAGNFNWGVRDSAFRYNGTTLNYTLSKNGTGVATYKNASVLQGFTLPSDPAIDEANHMFYLFRGFPVELYSVRMYDRTLSSGEVARNHFADLVKYTGISVASVRALSEAGYNMLVGAYVGQGFSSDKAALKAQLEEDIAKYAEFELNEYDDLYVKDGLVQLLTAFGTDYSTINTETGIWYSKAGASYATIKGGMYNAETNPYGWKPRANGGIGYDLTDAEMTAGKGNNSWIDLGSH